jgi:hypothetical protein
VASIVLIAIPLCSAQRSAASVLVAGTLYDGTASSQKLLDAGGASGDWKVPLADQDLRLDVLGAGPVKSFTLKTDAEGRFSLDGAQAGLDRLAEGARLVANAKVGGEVYYSASFAPAASGLEVFAYRLGQSDHDVRWSLAVLHEVVDVSKDDVSKDKDTKLLKLKVSVRVDLSNRGTHLYVGRAAGRYREVLRLPVPEDAEVLVNHGPLPGLEFQRAAAAWYAIDEPIAGAADMQREFAMQQSPAGWQLEYLVPAAQYLTLAYPVPFRLNEVELSPERRVSRFLVYVVHEKMKVLGDGFLRIPQVIPTNPLSGSAGSFDVYVPTVPPGVGAPLQVAIEIDNALVGQVSWRTLKWHAGFLLLCLLAVVSGLALSRRAAPAEAVLGGLSSDQVLDRIAELDARYESGGIPEREYRRYREALVRIAAEEISGEEKAKAAAAPAPVGSSDGRQVSAPVRELLGRIGEIDRRDSVSAQAIQERAHLLEALYKRLQRDSEG